MRLVAIAVVAAACSAKAPEPRVVTAAERASTFEAEHLDTIDGTRHTHLAVGGQLHIRVPEGQVTWTNAFGPFAVKPSSTTTYVITATGAGSGEIEIETVSGYTRFAVTSAPLARVALAFDPANEKHATVMLLDASDKRLVDASLRVAPGSAAISFMRDAWDHIEFQTLPPGDVLVQTDQIGATRAIPAPSRKVACR